MARLGYSPEIPFANPVESNFRDALSVCVRAQIYFVKRGRRGEQENRKDTGESPANRRQAR